MDTVTDDVATDTDTSPRYVAALNNLEILPSAEMLRGPASVVDDLKSFGENPS